VVLAKSLLDWRQPYRWRKTFDRNDIVAMGLNRQHRATLHGTAIEQYTACPTLAGIAPDMNARQPQVLTQEVHQQHARLDLRIHLFSINAKRYLHDAIPQLAFVSAEYGREWVRGKKEFHRPDGGG